jgi:membrane protein
VSLGDTKVVNGTLTGDIMSRFNSVRAFTRDLYRIWITERPSQFAASLAYYGIFAFVPVVYIGLIVAGIFIDEIAAADQFYAQVADTLGTEAAQLLEDGLNRLSESSTEGTVLTSLISSLALFSAASLMFFQLQHALNTIWKVPPPKRGEIRAYLRKRLLAFVMVLGVGLFVILATLTNLVITTFNSVFGLDIIEAGITFLSQLGLTTVALALIYKVLPDAEITWRDVLVGSVVTALLIALGVKLLGIYLGTSNVTSALEAAGAVTVFLLTFYFVGQIFVFGAVFTRVYASRFGSKIVPTEESHTGDGIPVDATAQEQPPS